MSKRIIPFAAGLSIGAITTFLIQSQFQKHEITIIEPKEPTQESPFAKYGLPGSISQFIDREKYSLCYNKQTRNAEWVIERLESTQEKQDRLKSKFKEDPLVLKQFRSHLADYHGSGFDRGHLVPAADIQTSQKAMDDTFYLTNMSPQVPGLNRGYWASFEKFVRSLGPRFEEVYVVTGPLYLPKKEEEKYFIKYQVIGNPPNTAVPTHFFKGIEGNRQFIGSFVIPNEEISSTPLEDFQVSLSTIQHHTGLEFFNKIKRHESLCHKVDCILKNK